MRKRSAQKLCHLLLTLRSIADINQEVKLATTAGYCAKYLILTVLIPNFPTLVLSEGKGNSYVKGENDRD